MKTTIFTFSSKVVLLSTVTFIGLQCAENTSSDADEINTPINNIEQTIDGGKISTTKSTINTDDTDDTDETRDTDEIDAIDETDAINEINEDDENDADTTEKNLKTSKSSNSSIKTKDPIFKYTKFKEDVNANETLIITVHGLNVGSPKKDFKHLIPEFQKLGYTCFNTESRINIDKNTGIPDTHLISIDKQAEMLYKEILDLKNKPELITNLPSLKNICVIGHSLGGVVATRALKKYGNDIKENFNCKLIGTTLSSPMKGIEYHNPTVNELIKTEEDEFTKTVLIPGLSPAHSNWGAIMNLKEQLLEKENIPSEYPILYIKNSCNSEDGAGLLANMGIKQPQKNIKLFQDLHKNQLNDGLIPESSMVRDKDINSIKSKSQQYKMKSNCSHSDILTAYHKAEVAETISMFIQKQK